MKNNHLYIWQHDIYSLEILLICIANGVEINGFCSSQKKYDDICGYSVFDAVELIDKSEEITVLILSGEEKKRRNFHFIDVYSYIYSVKKNDKIISLREKPLRNIFSAGFFMLALDDYMKSAEKKSLVLLGKEGNEVHQIVIELLGRLKLTYVLMDFSAVGTNFSMAHESLYIIANSLDSLQHDYKFLCECGLEPYDDFIATRPFNYLGLDHDEIFRVMPVLGYRYQLSNKNESGYVQHGTREKDSYIVVTIGDSTTDEEYSYHDSWSRMLYEKLNKNRKAVVYNFGMRMYSVQQNLLTLISEVPILNPDLVILLAGDINMTYTYEEGNPFVTKVQSDQVDDYVSIYNEVKSNRISSCKSYVEDTNQYEMYLRCVTMMKAICDSMGSQFLSFLMPNITQKKSLSKYEQICCYDVFCKRDKNGIHKVFNEKYPLDSSNYEYMFDISNTFLETTEPIYADRCHLMPKGEQILAEVIWNNIKFKVDVSGE